MGRAELPSSEDKKEEEEEEEEERSCYLMNTFLRGNNQHESKGVCERHHFTVTKNKQTSLCSTGVSITGWRMEDDL